MCTISWLGTDSGYHVFFNRDEQKTRAGAIPPKVVQDSNIRAVMPIDPVGQGTWCASNEYGLTFALLNFYQGRWPKGKLTSRGKIVRNCAACANLDEAHDFVRRLDLSRYAPFSLLFFSPDQSLSNGVFMLRWTGKELQETIQQDPLISSSVRFDEVVVSRMSVYDDMISAISSDNLREDDFINMHSSHLPTKSALSLCMHREEAQTVSFSHVRVNNTDISFRYSDGSLCENELDDGIILTRA